jgi:hypothetical protein
MTKEDFYDDFLLIRQMKVRLERKVRLLTELLAEYPEMWLVTGVTEKALKIFFENNFRRKPKIGINRSHINDRSEIYKKMLNGEFEDCEKWWNFYLKNDKTILTTTTENKTGIWSNIYDIEPNLNLFRNQGFSWKHGKKEQEKH